MKVCPKCGKVIGFNSCFGAYICDECGWEDDTYNQQRIQYYSQRVIKDTGVLCVNVEKNLIQMNYSNYKIKH